MASTKAERLQEVVDRLQAVADATGDQGAFWHLGRLDVLATYVEAYTATTIDEYLDEAREALERLEES